MEKKICTIIASVSFIIGCVVLSSGMGNIMHTQRTVTVRGLAEREVDADMAVWKLTFNVGGNELRELQQAVVKQTKIAEDFLKEHGLNESDYSVLAPEINDASMNTWGETNRRFYTYIAKQGILVRSSKVDSVRAANNDTLELTGKGVSVSNDYESKVTYEFNGLNEIKPEMIALATENARKAAEQFAHDSGSKVGKIINATQGLFSIENAAAGLEEKKNVRVVTTVVYSIKD